MILVTGGAGFIGSHIVDKLIFMGEKVLIIDDLSTGLADNINSDATFVEGDIRDPLIVSEAFKNFDIRSVIHQAARINTSILTEEPLVDVGISLVGTLNLLNASAAHGVEKFLYASSVSVYGSPPADMLPVFETSPLKPVYSYGHAKRAAEDYVTFYGETRSVPFHILRYGNIYGPRQPVFGEVGVIAIFTRRLLAGEPLIIFGNGTNTRDYLYVDDAVAATVHLLGQPGSEIFNVASGTATSVKELSACFKNHVREELVFDHQPDRPGELGSFVSSIEKLRTHADWTPEVTLEEGIAKTIAYYEQ